MKITGTAERPRLSVFRSNRHLQIQVIDDKAGHTLLAFDDRGMKKMKGARVALGAKIGEELAGKAKKAGITKVVFDRGGYRYHGIVRAIAEGARKGGITV